MLIVTYRTPLGVWLGPGGRRFEPQQSDGSNTEDTQLRGDYVKENLPVCYRDMTQAIYDDVLRRRSIILSRLRDHPAVDKAEMYHALKELHIVRREAMFKNTSDAAVRAIRYQFLLRNKAVLVD